jgi:hypothetical protein
VAGRLVPKVADFSLAALVTYMDKVDMEKVWHWLRLRERSSTSASRVSVMWGDWPQRPSAVWSTGTSRMCGRWAWFFGRSSLVSRACPVHSLSSAIHPLGAEPFGAFENDKEVEAAILRGCKLEKPILCPSEMWVQSAGHFP